MAELRPIKVGLHPTLLPWAAEIKYVLRTLLRVAGYPHEFSWVTETDASPFDLYYGPRHPVAAAVSIEACGKPFTNVAWMEPRRVHEQNGLPFLEFADGQDCGYQASSAGLVFANDIVLACYWLLSGARETYYPRNVHGTIDLQGRLIQESGLVRRPLVSLYGALLRRHFQQRGHTPLELPWISPRGGATFIFSHDVDYPQMIRWIEVLRLLRQRGLKSFGSIAGVLRGTNHFWKFADWLEFEKQYGAKSAFYFMARKGSLVQYALGTPDVFYDIRRPAFKELFRTLTGEGHEIGLHTSYHAYRSLEQVQHEKRVLEEAAGVTIEGNRHHYFHLDPAAPYETLRKHEQAGFLYDSSLTFESFPGFRRGSCHPYRVFHPGERRELNILQLPCSLMDDHFDRRLALNKVADPEACVLELLETARATGGVIIADYHARGMNADFYPRYGAWLREFARKHFDSSMNFPSPRQLARQYLEYEKQLDVHSTDRTAELSAGVSIPLDERIAFGPMRAEEIAETALLHHNFFGIRAEHGTSVAKLGPDFLADFFYRLNLDNPYLFIDLARYQGKVVGFSVFASDWTKVSGWMLHQHRRDVFRCMLRCAFRHPIRLARYVMGNLQFLKPTAPEFVNDVPAMFMLIGVKRECRSRRFTDRTGTWVAADLCQRVDEALWDQGCRELHMILGVENGAVNHLFKKQGAQLVGQGWVQGVWSNYYRLPIELVGPSLKGPHFARQPVPAKEA